MTNRLTKIAVTILFFLSITIFFSKAGYAVEHQLCPANSSCVVGEFLYDDNYSPMTGATCTLTSKYPNGSTFLNAVSMSGGSDGWYSYTVTTTGEPDGIYPSQVCCDTTDTPSQHLCLDKTFTIGPPNLYPTQVASAVWDESRSGHTAAGSFGKNLQNPVLLASEIWGYSSRTLTGFGTLIADIWAYSGRSLDSFGTLVSDIWNNGTRTLSSATLSGGGQLTKTTDLDSAVTSIKGASDKDLSQVYSGVSAVQNTTNTISSQLTSLQTSVTTLGSTMGTVLSKWGSYSASDIISQTSTLSTTLGSTADACSASTVFGSIRCVRDKWGSQTADTLYTAANNAYTTATSLRSELNYNGKSTNAYDDVQSIISSLSLIRTSIGNSSDASSVLSLFGKAKKTQEDVATVQTTVDTISSTLTSLQSSVTTMGSSVSTIITKWGNYSASDIITQTGVISTRIGTTADTCSGASTVFGSVQCIREKWGNQTADTIYTAANNASTTISSLRSEINYNGKSTTAYQDIQSLLTNLSLIQTSIGNSSDSSSVLSLFGKAKKTQEDVAGVQTSVDSISTKIDTMQTSVTTMGSSVNTLISKWGVYTASDIITQTSGLSTTLGSTADSCNSATVFGTVRCVRDKWGSQTADAIYTAANNAYSTITSLRSELNYNGKSSNAYDDIQTLKSNLASIQTSIGNSSDASSVLTLFGKLKKNQEDIAGVQTTVDSISTKVDTLTTSVTSMNSNVSTLVSKWGSYSITDVLAATTTLSTTLGTTTDTCSGSSTIFGSIRCVRDKWGSQTADAIYTAANNASTAITSLRSELGYNGKSTIAYDDLQTLKTSTSNMASALGTSGDSSSTSTIFGRVKKVQESIDSLNTANVDVSSLLERWGDISATDIYNKVSSISSDISNIDATPDLSSVITEIKNNSTDISSLKNSVLELKAVIDVTKQLVQSTSDTPIIKTWLEEGSIIFKTLITNPSTTTSKVVPLKFYLPSEVDKKDIMKIDPGISLAYDPNESAYYISGEFNLVPQETRTFSVEVNDIWKITKSQVDSLKNQADELYVPLKNTSFFAQGATLHSDILAALDNVVIIQKDAQTPDARIKAYREALVEYRKAKNDINDLKTLATSASSNNAFLAFVGGSQAVSSWALIIVFVGGFISLSFAMKYVTKQRVKKPQSSHPTSSIHTAPFFVKRALNWKILSFLAIVGVTAIGSLVTILFVKHLLNVTPHEKKSDEETRNIILTPTLTSLPEEINVKNSKQVLGIDTEDTYVFATAEANITQINVRKEASLVAPIITKVKPGTSLRKYSTFNGWVEVEVNVEYKGAIYNRGWIKNDFVTNK